MKPRLLVIGDVPPPVCGPEIGIAKLMRSDIHRHLEITRFGFALNDDLGTRGDLTAAKLLRYLSRLAALVRTLHRTRPHLVYHYFSQTPAGFTKDLPVILLARAAGAHLLLHLRGSNFAAFYYARRPSQRRLIRHAIAAADIMLVQSPCIAPVFDGILPPHKVRIFPNALEDHEIAPRAAGHHDAPLRIIFLGNLSLSKGYGDLLRAVPLVRETCPGARFTFAGPRVAPEDEKNIRLDLDSASLADEISRIEQTHGDICSWPGVVRDEAKIRLLDSHDIFVLPSYSEGFATVILEAMGRGLPLITTPVGANPDLFTDTPRQLVPPGNPRALAEAIRHLAEHPDERRELGQRNLDLVRRQFRMENAVAHLTNACRSAREQPP